MSKDDEAKTPSGDTAGSNEVPRRSPRRVRPAPGEPRVSDKIRAATGEERKEVIERLPWENGYAKPPVEHQFKPGQSGNRKGRPKKSENVATIVARIGDEPVDFTSGGKKRRAPATEVALRRQQQKSLAGDRKATELLIGLRMDHEKVGGTAPDPVVYEAFIAVTRQLFDVMTAVGAGEPLDVVKTKIAE